MRCPKCYSENCQIHTHITKQGYHVGKGCCGFLLLGGPLGLLCGLCGKDEVVDEERYWMCNNCGTKFDDSDGKVAIDKYNAKQKVLEAGSELEKNSNIREILEKKDEIRKILKAKLSLDELERFIFFETGCKDSRVEEIFYTFREMDLDLKQECIYFMYSEGSFNSNFGIIVSSDGIYFKQGLKYYMVPQELISKVYIEKEKIRIDSLNHVSFKQLTNVESRKVVVEVLRKLYVNTVIEKQVINHSSAGQNVFNDEIAWCGSCNGFVAQVEDKLFYYDKDLSSLVVRKGDNEIISLKGMPNSMCQHGKDIYLTHDGNAVSHLNTDTYEYTTLYKQNCNSVTAYNGKIAFSNFSDKSSLYIMNTDGSEPKKITDDRVSDIVLTNDWIYYINKGDKNSIYKIKQDGSNRTKIFGEMKCCRLSYEKGYLYFQSDAWTTYNNLYRVSENGENLILIRESAKDYVVSKKTIYISQDDSVVFIDKDDLSKAYYFIKNKKTNNLNIVNKYLYFCSPPSLVGHGVTHRVKCEGGTIEKL